MGMRTLLPSHRSARRLSRGSGIACALAVLPALLGAQEPPPANTGQPRALAGAAPHAYSLALEAGDYLEVRVEQLGIDVVLRLHDPSGRLLHEVDSPTGEWDAETLVAIVDVAGDFRLEVAAWMNELPARISSI